MDVTALDTQTDKYAKSNSTMFPLDEKLIYYIEADGILNSLIIDEQEDTNESEPTPITTVANQRNYAINSRSHHLNWAKIDYGDGFIPARYKSQLDLISEYGNDLETVLSQWDKSDPIYWFESNEINVVPAPSASQAGSGRLKYSTELIPSDLDRTTNTTPTLVPPNFHFLHAAYAARSWLDKDDSLWEKNDERWNTGVKAMLTTMFPKARQVEMIAHVPDNDGSDY